MEKAKKKAKQIKQTNSQKFFERGSVHINYCFQSNRVYFFRAQAFKVFSRH